jgi:acyl carrier protein
MSEVAANIYHSLHEVFFDVFGRDDIRLSPTTTADQIAGWDSFKQIEIILAVSERFDIRIPTREVDKFQNVGDLAASIEAALQRKSK